jgi:hypothetical protein
MKDPLYSKNRNDPLERLRNLRESWPTGYMFFFDGINGLLKLLEIERTCEEHSIPCGFVTSNNIEGLRLLIEEKFNAFTHELDEIYWDLRAAQKGRKQMKEEANREA